MSDIANLSSAVNGAVGSLQAAVSHYNNQADQISGRVAAAESAVNGFIARATQNFVGARSRIGVIDQRTDSVVVRTPQLSAGPDGAEINIIDLWKTGEWGHAGNCVIRAYSTYVAGGFAEYYWSGNTFSLMRETVAGSHPTFNVTDHGIQTHTGHVGSPTYRIGLNVVIPAYNRCYCEIETLSYNRIYGNDHPETVHANFGNDGSALIFKTLTNEQLGVTS